MAQSHPQGACLLQLGEEVPVLQSLDAREATVEPPLELGHAVDRLLMSQQLGAAQAHAPVTEGRPEGGPCGRRLISELGHEAGPMGAVGLVVQPVPDIPQV